MLSDITKSHITILTPTWNRRHLLPRLYQSLVEQDSPQGTFEWLVIDDGSTDGTYEWIEEIIPTSPFPIRVIRQENGGQHRALNRGVQEINSEWVLEVGSDDWFLPGAMDKIIEETISARQDTSSIVAPLELVGKKQGNFIITTHSADYMTRRRQTQVGDVSIIARKEAVRQVFPLPEFAGETYLQAGLARIRLLTLGGTKLSNQRIAVAEYQPQGLSHRSLQLRAQNPLGALLVYKTMLAAGSKGAFRIRDQLNFHRFYWHALRLKKQPKRHGFRIHPLWAFPGWLVYRRDLRLLKN